MELIFATNNGHKMREVSEMLSGRFELVGLAEAGIHEDIPETAPTIEGNALMKARYVYERLGKDCFADDTGLEVDALGGAPGVHSARYATDGHDDNANIRLLLKNLEGCAERTARFRTVIVLIVGGEEYMFEGVVGGAIALEPHGNEGYDPVFVQEGHGESFAQLGEDVKNVISHRARVTRKLAEFLKQVLSTWHLLPNVYRS